MGCREVLTLGHGVVLGLGEDSRVVMAVAPEGGTVFVLGNARWPQVNATRGTRREDLGMKRGVWVGFCTLLWACRIGVAFAQEVEGNWPQWHGPNRDGVSDETGLLSSWPEGGPKVLWRAPLGEGYSGMSIVGGRVYTMYARDDDEFAVCLDASDGWEIWRFRTGSMWKNDQGDGSRSTPTIQGGSAYVLAAEGKLYALDALDGTKKWSRDFVAEFGSTVPGWGYSASPLIADDLVLVEVGGKGDQSIVAFDKTDGQTVWAAHSDEAAYSSPITIDFGGWRQAIFLTSGHLLSVSPADGRIYWTYPWPEGPEALNICTPRFIPDDKVFISTWYDEGSVLLRMKETEGGLEVEEVWKSRVMKNQFNSPVLRDGYLYGFDNAFLTCIEASTGEERWVSRGFGKGSLILAADHLVVLGDSGELALVEATPTGFVQKASAPVLQGKCWTVPALAGGRLYVRNQEEMLSLEMKDES